MQYNLSSQHEKTNLEDTTGPIGVNLHSIGRTFGNVHALQGVDFDISPGSFSVLIGPSGCGKTTLLRMIGGLDSPSEGTLQYFDRSGTEVDADQRALSYGFQEPRLLPWRSVYDNVALPLVLNRVDEKKQCSMIEDMLERVGLLEARNRLPHELSGGMRMRAAIARALVTQPRLLLLDEPFGALDEITKSRLDDELLNLWQRLDVTVVLVTHSLSEAVYLGERIHILSANPGKLSSTLEVPLSGRTPNTRTSEAFAQYVGEAHRLLAIAEIGEVKS